MAAIAYPMADPWVAARPNRPDVWAYRRRRAVVLLALAAAIFVAATSIRLALAGPGGGALTTSGSAGAMTPMPSSGGASSSRRASGYIYVAQPGDTLWSIVVASGRYGDPRPEVDRLSRQLGDRPLEPGQRLSLP